MLKPLQCFWCKCHNGLHHNDVGIEEMIVIKHQWNKLCICFFVQDILCSQTVSSGISCQFSWWCFIPMYAFCDGGQSMMIMTGETPLANVFILACLLSETSRSRSEATPSRALPCLHSWLCVCRTGSQTSCCWCHTAMASTWAVGSNAWRPKVSSPEHAAAAAAGPRS